VAISDINLIEITVEGTIVLPFCVFVSGRVAKPLSTKVVALVATQLKALTFERKIFCPPWQY
jgi:hypothetical protein